MEKIQCPICHNLQTEELFKTKDRFKISDQNFGIRKCLNCEIVFTSPALNWEEMEKFYSKDILWRKECETKNKFIKLVKKFEEIYIGCWLRYETKRLLKFIGKKGNLLDIGCGTGTRLEYFKRKGFNQCLGIEPSKDAIYAKEIKKLPVEQKTLEEFACPENSFDIVTLYHVFEHFDNPVYCLKKIKKILKPNGSLVIQVPNFNSLQAKLFKERWLFLGIPVHYFHYTPRTISSFLIQNGFKIKKIDYMPNLIHPFFWSLSVFPNLNPQLMWEKEKEKVTILYRILWFLVTMLLILPAELENLFGGGT